MRDKRFATAVATLLAAFATAHLMQFGFSAGRAFSRADGAPIGLATLVARPTPDPARVLPENPHDLPRLSEAAAGIPRTGERSIPRDEALPAVLRSAGGSEFGLNCERALAAGPAPGGRISVQIRAACDPGVRVEIRHEGLRFALSVGADGTAEATFPALVPDALVEASLGDGTVLRARTSVPEAGRYEHVALVADGWAGLALRAVEQGVRMGEPGPLRWSAGSRGTLRDRLGDPDIDAPLLAEVYTFPAGRFGSLNRMRIDLEAEVTAANCARDIVGTVVRTAGGRVIATEAVQVAMPSCGAEGDILVMDLTPPDTRLAGN